MLQGKVAFVTGCSRGIGRAIAKLFALNNAKVYANTRSMDCLNNLQKEFENDRSSSEGEIRAVVFDVRDRPAVKRAFTDIMKESGRLDCVVNNAGILVDTLITMLDRATLQEIFDVNVLSAFEIISLASRIMTKQKSGSIINIASVCGVEGGMRGQTAYSSSKGAIIALTKTAAKELGADGIRVNAVAPGFIETDMFRSGPPEIQKSLVEGVYLNNRVGTAEEVAEVCLFLASNKASYVTGQIIGVDGFAHI